MNYLAHLLLAEATPEAWVGNLLGDFVKGAVGDLGDRYPVAIRQGILLHRQIDAFTDAHPVVQTSKARIAPERRRFAGVLVDMFYDHFLARHWQDYASIALPEFAEQVYHALQTHEVILPERLQRVLPDIIRQNWLTSYQDIDGIAYALQRMSRRIHRTNPLALGIVDLQTHYDGLEADFRAFWPEVVGYVNTLQARSRVSPAPWDQPSSLKDELF